MKSRYWLVAGLCAAVAGCGGKVEITSSCAIQDSGEIHCTFKNAGSAKGNECVHAVLTKKPELIAKEQAEKGRHNESWQVILSMVAEQAKGARASLIKSVKDEAKSGNASLDAVIEERRTELISLAASDTTYVSTEKICSGLVEAGGTRDAKGMATFTGKSPRALCALSPDGAWSDGCTLSTTFVADLDKSIKKVIKTASDK